MASTNRWRGLNFPSSTGLARRTILISFKLQLKVKKRNQCFVKQPMLLIKMSGCLCHLYVPGKHVALPGSVLLPVSLHLFIGRRGTHVSIKENGHSKVDNKGR